MRRSSLAALCLAAIASVNVATAADSELVALAKRTNRKASKTRVITNDTLVRSSGHVSQAAVPPTPTAAYTAAQATPQPRPTPEARPTPQSPSTPQPQPTPQAAPSYAQPTTQSGSLPTTARFEEPRSSAQYVTPQSSARSMTPTSTVQSSTPPTSVRWSEPASSARSVPIP